MDTPAAEGAGKRRACEELRKRLVPDVQATGVGAERRQDKTLAIGDETSPAHASARAADLGRGVKVARNLARRRARLRLMPETKAGDLELVRRLARQRLRSIRVVISDDPDEPAACSQRPQPIGVISGEPALGTAIMERVAQQNDRGR